MSGMQGLKRFIVRVQSSGGELRGVTILLRSGHRRRHGAGRRGDGQYFQGFPDPNAAPPPGLRRNVEYGTAIVVSGRRRI